MKLTISMATFDDYDGVFFTLQSLRLHHTLPEKTEVIIIDNNPESSHGKATAALAKSLPMVRVIPVTDRVSSWVKYDAFELAQGEIILGLDCHVLLKPGFIDNLMDYWAKNPNSRDLLTGPLIYNDLSVTSAMMEPRWSGHDYGCWADAPELMEKGMPFEIPMQGMGCFSFRTSNAPIPCKLFRGFGAEEWYMAERVRQGGGRVICHPKLAWLHRFDWPQRKFPLTFHDRVRNYYLGWMELYKSSDHPMVQGMISHMRSIFPNVDNIIKEI
jgi:hypothetical protein